MHPLVAYRERRGLTQDDLGELLGVTGSAVCRWEQWDRRLSGEMLLRVADLIGVDVRTLVERPQ